MNNQITIELTNGMVTFKGPRGSHTIASNDIRRVEIHYVGFCENNGVTVTKLPALLRASAKTRQAVAKYGEKVCRELGAIPFGSLQLCRTAQHLQQRQHVAARRAGIELLSLD